MLCEILWGTEEGVLRQLFLTLNGFWKAELIKSQIWVLEVSIHRVGRVSLKSGWLCRAGGQLPWGALTLLKEWSGIGTDCPGKWWSRHPWRVQKTHRCGTSGHGLVGMVVLGWWLDLMILEVFSNLWFYDQSPGTRWGCRGAVALAGADCSARPPEPLLGAPLRTGIPWSWTNSSGSQACNQLGTRWKG